MRTTDRTAGIAEEAARFWRDGFVVVRKAFSAAEMDVLREVIQRHDAMNAHARRARERSAGPTRPSFETIFVWNDDGGSDVFSKATRSHRVIDRLEAIFDDEVYVYHNKVALKYPGVVGFSYHQDYAYWYEMGNLFPDMATVSIAVDRATRENGCLRLIAGSHRLGRMQHVDRDPGSDSGVDPERLERVLAVLPEATIELDVGDMVIFHCNTLHASDDNHSDRSRVALLGCYNTRHNSPFKTVHGHPAFQAYERLADRITEADLENLPTFA
ncbi:MAG TPA: phytanoyl-CoA dioxygenase family protein [Usitatibacter sp.]|nr:phytanoyl-CoA dioxygenase family protein [Usitatibacter sp.]